MSICGASQLFFSRKAVQARYFGRLIRDRFEFGTSPSYWVARQKGRRSRCCQKRGNS